MISDYFICIVFNLECYFSAFPSDYLLFLNVSGCANSYSLRKGLCILIRSLVGLNPLCLFGVNIESLAKLNLVRSYFEFWIVLFFSTASSFLLVFGLSSFGVLDVPIIIILDILVYIFSNKF